MKIVMFGAAVAAGVILVLCVGVPARAASPATEIFLQNVVPNVDFLDRSSRLALTNSKDHRLHDFAFSEAKEQTLAANAVDAWVEAHDKLADAGPVQTGRSVAVDGQPKRPVDTRLPHGQEDLDSLEGLSGAAFDAEYKDKQIDALRQLEADYRDYLAGGDDPALLSIAKRALPQVRRSIQLVGKI